MTHSTLLELQDYRKQFVIETNATISAEAECIFTDVLCTSCPIINIFTFLSSACIVFYSKKNCI